MRSRFPSIVLRYRRITFVCSPVHYMYSFLLLFSFHPNSGLLLKLCSLSCLFVCVRLAAVEAKKKKSLLLCVHDEATRHCAPLIKVCELGWRLTAKRKPIEIWLWWKGDGKSNTPETAASLSLYLEDIPMDGGIKNTRRKVGVASDKFRTLNRDHRSFLRQTHS
jgi:hypothetical protein